MKHTIYTDNDKSEFRDTLSTALERLKEIQNKPTLTNPEIQEIIKEHSKMIERLNILVNKLLQHEIR